MKFNLKNQLWRHFSDDITITESRGSGGRAPSVWRFLQFFN